MSEKLFSDFFASDKTAWIKQAEIELKGPVSKFETWKISEFKIIEPYLTAEDLNIDEVSALQNCQKKIPGWINVPGIDFQNAWLTNSKIIESLKTGAHGILLNIEGIDLEKCEFPKLLHTIRLSDIPIFFETEQNQNQLFDLISNGAGYYIRGGVAHDPIAHWMLCGQDFKESFEEIVKLLKKTEDMREFYPFMVESHVYHNAGATPVQELALITGTMVSYIDMLTDAGISPLQACNRFFLSISVGTEYLTEIAKLRALRFLYRRVSRAYGLPNELCTPFIHTKTSSFFATAQLPHNNIIRATSEAMSAVIGGCNALTVKAYNDTISEPDEFANRIARNTSSILSGESYLDKVADPAAGSYLIEELSNQLAEAAWKMFLEMETKGGLITCFNNGIIQDELEKSWNSKTSSIQSERIIVGVNKYESDNQLSEILKFSSLDKQEGIVNNVQILPIRNLANFFKPA